MSNIINIIVDLVDLGLDQVNNTSDLNKPISNATQTALNEKENVSNKSTDPNLGDSDEAYPSQKAVKTYIANQISSATIPDATNLVKGKIKLAGDLSGTADAPTVPALAGKEPLIATGNSTQYWRGDKSWQTLNQSAVGLDQVNNTSDANKPISIATQTALNLKQDALGYTPENVTNKENTTLDFSTTKYPTNNLIKTTLNNYLLSSLKGANNGLAELDSSGKVPSSQLPSYVDDILEFDTLSEFPVTGESGKIYIAKNTNIQYRWSGTTYVEISSSLALGETSSTAYRGDRGKIAYDHSQTTGNPHGATTNDIPESTNKRYVSDAQLVVIGNTSGVNTGDQDLSGLVPYTGATQDVDLGNNALNAKSFHIKGTGGAGHLALKHQTADATAGGQETALFADVNGDLKYKNDGGYYTTYKTSLNTNNRVYTFRDRNGIIADDTDLALKESLANKDTYNGYVGLFHGKITFFDTNTTWLSQIYNLNTAPREYIFPDKTGTMAMLDDIAGKQDTLVSGTNIKTINGNSILGSGNITISGGATEFIPRIHAFEIFRGRTFRVDSTTVDTFGGINTLNNASAVGQLVSATNFFSKFPRLRYYASIVQTGRQTDIRGTDLQWFVGGGFRFVTTFRVADTVFSSNTQQFYGLGGYTTQLPYAGTSLIQLENLVNLIGIGSNATDSNLNVYYNDASGLCSKIDLGINFPANRTSGSQMTTMYSIQIYNEVNSNEVKYEVINLETGAIAQGTLTTDLPSTSQGLTIFASRCMGTPTTNTGQFEVHKWGCYDIIA